MRRQRPVSEHTSYLRQSSRRQRFVLHMWHVALLLLATALQQAHTQFLPGDSDTSRLTAAERSIRAACKVQYSCGNFFFSRTPFSVTGAQYDTAAGRLCYKVAADRACGSCSNACRAATGISALYMMAPDLGVKPAIASKGLLRNPRVSPPHCKTKWGIAAVVQAQKASGTILPKGGRATTLCLQYPRGTPFRRIGRILATAVPLPAQQACCSAAAAYRPMSAKLDVWARGAGPVSGTGAGCQACTSTPVTLTTGSIAGHVWQDSDGSNTFTVGVDEGFEGVTVNLWRIQGTTRTFLGCTSTDGTGAYKFSKVVPDYYSVQVVRPDAGPRAAMRFAKRGAGTNPAIASDVYQGSGQTPTLRTNSGATTTVNALIQVVPSSTAR